ncbi:MAG: hypothetical protein ACRCTL_02910 [Pseudomonas sp.]
MLPRLFNLLLCAGLTLFCTTLSASEASAGRAHLHQLQLALQGTLGDFYLLYGVDNDPLHGQSLERRLEATNLHLEMLDELASSPADPSLEQIRQQWPAYAELLRRLSARVQEQGELDGNALVELIQRNSLLMALCAALQASQSQTDDPLAQRSNALELQLQSLTTSYIAYSIGANSLGGDGQAIDQLARQFEGELGALRQPLETPQYQRLREAIQAKWRYIEPALRNYQKSAIPSLVNHYSARIIENLARLQLASQAPATP